MATENVQQTVSEKDKPDQPEQNQVRLVDVEVSNQNIALNVIMSFVSLAQQRGAFNIQESAKIWECIKHFRPEQPPPAVSAPAGVGAVPAVEAAEAAAEAAVEAVVEAATSETAP